MRLTGLRKLRFADFKGDTLVEVLICIAIVGMVIAGSYALASRSLRQGITATERTEAIKLAEGQIEAFKFRQQETSDPAVWNSNFKVGNNFCLVPSALSPVDANWPIRQNSGSPTNLVIASPGYNNNCASPLGAGRKYFINITTNSSPPLTASPTYLVTVRWQGAANVQNQAQLYYRF